MKKYKVGDRVKLIKNINGTSGELGNIYTIEYSNPMDIDYCLGGLISGWVTEEEIELAN